MSSLNIYLNSPIQKVLFRGVEVLIKRDDLLNSDFSGNKARKFYYYLVNDFKKIDKIISYGSNQSNAMYSLSVLAKLKNWKFDYYVSHLPTFLKNNPIGNYKYALENGMNLIVSESFNSDMFLKKENELFIQEGGADSFSEYGLKLLAKELEDYQDYSIFLPSGTGTTALYLQKYLKQKVYTCPCVGDSDYLKKQFSFLENKNYPTILETSKKYHFGKLYREIYSIWLELKQDLNIEFSLLYDGIGWLTLFENIEKFDKIIYIHQGGIIGNESMIQRYERKYKEF